MHMTGAMVNGKYVSYDYILKTGDTVAIDTGDTIQMNEGWLDLAKTKKTKSTIRRYLRKFHSGEMHQGTDNISSDHISHTEYTLCFLPTYAHLSLSLFSPLIKGETLGSNAGWI